MEEKQDSPHRLSFEEVLDSPPGDADAQLRRTSRALVQEPDEQGGYLSPQRVGRSSSLSSRSSSWGSLFSDFFQQRPAFLFGPHGLFGGGDGSASSGSSGSGWWRFPAWRFPSLASFPKAELRPPLGGDANTSGGGGGTGGYFYRATNWTRGFGGPKEERTVTVAGSQREGFAVRETETRDGKTTVLQDVKHEAHASLNAAAHTDAAPATVRRIDIQ